MPERHHIRVEFESGDHIDTEINGTEEEIKAYYIGNVFNLGVNEDKMDTAVSVAFIEPETTYTNSLNGRSATVTTEHEGPKRCWERIEMQDADTITITWKRTFKEACNLAVEWVYLEA